MESMRLTCTRYIHVHVWWITPKITLNRGHVDTQETFGCPKHPSCFCTLQPLKSMSACETSHHAMILHTPPHAQTFHEYIFTWPENVCSRDYMMTSIHMCCLLTHWTVIGILQAICGESMNPSIFNGHFFMVHRWPLKTGHFHYHRACMQQLMRFERS